MSVLQKNKKVAAGIGVAAAAAAVLALGAGTYAAFSDTETGPQTTLAAGSLDLTVGGGSVTSGPTNLNNLKPGDRVTVSYPADNLGTVDGLLSVSFTATGTEGGACVDPENDNTVDPGCNSNSELLSALEVQYGAQTYNLNAVQGQSLELGLMRATDPGQTYAFTYIVPNAGNEIMTDTVTINATATLRQAP